MKRSSRAYSMDFMSKAGLMTVAFMALSAVFRLIGVSGMGHDKFFIASQVVLPLCANLLYIMAIVIFGKSDFAMTLYPVILGVMFFAVKALTFESMIHTLLCLLLYAGVLIIYILVLNGTIRTQYILIPLFALPLAVHVIMDIFRIARGEFTVSDFMQELSVLMIMASLECLPFGMKNGAD